MPTVTIMGLPERFWAKTRIEDAGYETPCLTWTATRLDGYGRVGWQGKVCYAHRVAYEAQVGRIPAGLFLDHLCRNRSCVNVSHLEPVTNRINLLRGDTFAARNASKTHCKSGHPFDEANTRVTPGGNRACIACGDRLREARNADRRADRAANPAVPKTHCRRGHPLSGPNMRHNAKGARVCLTCAGLNRKAYLERKAAQGDAWGKSEPTGADGLRLWPSQARALEWLEVHGTWDPAAGAAIVGRTPSDTKRVFEKLLERGLVEITDGRIALAVCR